MTMDATLAFVLAFGANVVWDIVLGATWISYGPRGRADIYSDAVVLWLFPLIMYLVVLYRKGVFVRLPRALRAVVFCGISFVAGHMALICAEVLATIVWFVLHGAPKPNEFTSADGGWPVLLASIAQWPAAAEFLRSA
jgi:hypothetical protein